MAPMTNTIKFKRYLQGLAIVVNNFAFEIKAILGLEVTRPSCQVAKIGLNGPCDQQG